MSNLIAITIGDIKGIGIDILIKAQNSNKINNYILFTNEKIINNYLKKSKIKLKINKINSDKKNIGFEKNKINIFSYKARSLEENTFKSLEFAYKFCVNKICIGIITLPLRKDLIKNKIDKNFIGQTEFFQNIDKKDSVNMILFHKKIIVSPLTTHIEVKKISKIISNKKFLYKKIVSLYNSLKFDFMINKPKIIISGFNPHSGENGNIGQEEIKSLIPVIKKLKKNGISIYGPFSADSILVKENLKNYDCFVFMFHDQALIPFKYISQFSGVNYTSNLKIIRTSPDHGTAYNLVGTNKITDKSFINCFKLVKKIYKNRIINGKS